MQVRRLADEVRGAYPRLDVLINNAGGAWAIRRTASSAAATEALHATTSAAHILVQSFCTSEVNL